MKYYLVSDTHSFFFPLEKALKENNFNPKEDTLVVLGDVFDRGEETTKLYNYLTSLDNLILIRGNHEYLYEELLGKECPSTYDFSNGTVSTFCQIAGTTVDKLIEKRKYGIEEYQEEWIKIRNKVLESDITKWIESDQWKDYYEIKNYILVHSFIPLKVKPEYEYSYGRYHIYDDYELEYNPNWRDLKDFSDWYQALWGCPWSKYQLDLFKPEEDQGKTLVCGHWHSSDFRKHLAGIPQDSTNPDYSAYISKGIVALDACTVLSKEINVFIIED